MLNINNSNPSLNIDLEKSFSSRFSSKSFDSSKKLNQSEIDSIIDAANYAPTSFGIQPFKIIEVTNDDLKSKIEAIGYGQPQFTTCDRIFIWAIEKDIKKSIDEYMERVVNSGRLNNDAAAGFRKYIDSHIDNNTVLRHSNIENWNAKQAYISLGFALAACAVLGVSSCAMEGFDPDKLDELLELDKIGLRSVVILTIGVIKEGDADALKPKVRKTKEELVLKY